MTFNVKPLYIELIFGKMPPKKGGKMAQRVCTKCGNNKNSEEFYKRRIGSQIGFHAQCKTCMKSINQKYRTQNLDKIKEKRKRYSDESLNKKRESQKAWLSKNPSYFKEYRQRKIKGEDGFSNPKYTGANNRSEVISI